MTEKWGDTQGKLDLVRVIRVRDIGVLLYTVGTCKQVVVLFVDALLMTSTLYQSQKSDEWTLL